MVYFYQLFLNTDDVILKLYTSLCQKAKCTLFVWSTVVIFLLVASKTSFNLPGNRYIIGNLIMQRTMIHERAALPLLCFTWCGFAYKNC